MLFQDSSIFIQPSKQEPFLALQNNQGMKKLAQTRQKLIINRQRKSQIPLRLQVEVRNGTTAVVQVPKLANTRNSLIVNKQNFSEPDKKESNHRVLMKGRSISVLQLRQRSKSKVFPLFPAVISNSEEKSSLSINRDEPVLKASRIILAKMMQRGAISIKNGSYTIHHEDFFQLIAQSVEKASPQSNKKSNNSLSQASQIKAAPCSTPYEGLQIFQQFSIQQTNKKMRSLHQQSRVIDQHHAFEEDATNRQAFWRIVNNSDLERPTEQNVRFLLNKIKYLRQEANQQEAYVRELKIRLEELSQDISNKEEFVEAIQEKTAECSRYLEEVQEAARQMGTFIDKQPNRILQQQARQYKQREQELFDLAFLYEQQAHSSVSAFIYESIMIPYESFKLTTQSFPQDFPDEEGFYSVSKKSMDQFKASIKSAYESTTEKLSVIIERKTNKIKNFVSIMRRLASYTIGKREYLGQINKKMAVVSIRVDKSFMSLEGQLAGQSPTGSVLERVAELRQLFQTVRTVYCEAQVFY